MEIPKDLKNEIWDYCRLNNITNINDFMLTLLKQGFTVEKYGATPKLNTVEKIVEKVITDDETVKQLHAELQTEKAKNLELTKKLENHKKINDIYGES